jgi:hypothetical protein
MIKPLKFFCLSRRFARVVALAFTLSIPVAAHADFAGDAAGAMRLLEAKQFGKALAALQKIAPRYQNEFALHYMMGLSQMGRVDERTKAADAIKFLKASRTSLLRAQTLAQNDEQKQQNRELLDVAETGLRELGALPEVPPAATPATKTKDEEIEELKRRLAEMQGQPAPLAKPPVTPRPATNKSGTNPASTRPKANPLPATLAALAGDYITLSGGVPELQTDGPISKAPVSTQKAFDRMASSAGRFRFRADGTVADIEYGERYASDPKYNGRYTINSKGEVKMYFGQHLLYHLRPAQTIDGEWILIQVHEPKDAYKARIFRRVEKPGKVASATTSPPEKTTPAAPVRPAPQTPAAVEQAPQTPPQGLIRGHVNWPFAYPGNVLLVLEDYARTPEDAVVEVTFKSLDGGQDEVVRRTLRQIRAGTMMNDSRPLAETGYIPVLTPGLYRVGAMILSPQGENRKVDLRPSDGVSGREVQLRWMPGERYQESGGKTVYVTINPD